MPHSFEGRGAGPWLLSRGRRLRPHEGARLQGIVPETLSWLLSRTRIFHLLGDSMSLNVVERILLAALKCIGLPDVPRDRWACGLAQEALVLGASSARSTPALTGLLVSGPAQQVQATCQLGQVPASLQSSSLRSGVPTSVPLGHTDLTRCCADFEPLVVAHPASPVRDGSDNVMIIHPTDGGPAGNTGSAPRQEPSTELLRRRMAVTTPCDAIVRVARARQGGLSPQGPERQPNIPLIR